MGELTGSAVVAGGAISAAGGVVVDNAIKSSHLAGPMVCCEDRA